MGGEGGLHLPPPYVSERMELSVESVRAAEKAGGRSIGRQVEADLCWI